MSAFVIDPVHVDLILCTAINGPRDHSASHELGWRAPYVNELLDGIASGPVSGEVADLAGRALLRECVASVSYRYPDDSPDGLPGTAPGFDLERYEWTDFGPRLSAIECCKAINCYEYQSCEHPAWRGSGAEAFCEQLRRCLVGAMEATKGRPGSGATRSSSGGGWTPTRPNLTLMS